MLKSKEVTIKKGDFIIVFEKDNSTHIRGKVKVFSEGRSSIYSHEDITLDTGETIRILRRLEDDE